MSADCIACGAAIKNGRFCPTCGAPQPVASAAEDRLIGRTIGDRYQICELVGRGGMGRVYRAIHGALERVVAIKFINRQMVTNEGIVARFMAEARTASRLNHPNIVSVHDFGRTSPAEGGDLYFVMEFLSGPSLKDLLAAGPVPRERSVDILCQVLGALGEAHRHGVTHRDVKPENIHLEHRRSGGDHVKMIDFGIAKPVTKTGSARVTRAGELVGTPSHMAPEQARGEAVGPEADLYAVGVILFTLLTGRRPFEGRTTEAIIAQHLMAPRPNPRAVAPERTIPAALADVCVRAMAVDPAHRYPTAEALARAIVQGAGQSWTAERAHLFPVSAVAPPSLSSLRGRYATHPNPGELADDEDATPAGANAVAPVNEAGPQSARSRHTTRLKRVPAKKRSLAGREAELAWARDLIDGSTEGIGLALSGRPGTGRTQLLAEIAAIAAERGARVIHAPSRPRPHGEVSWEGLCRIIPLIAGQEAMIPLVGGPDSSRELDASDLIRLFSRKRTEDEPQASASRRAPWAALWWAVRRALGAARGAPIILAIDDVDHMDGVSQTALGEVLSGDAVPGLVVLVTSESASGRWLGKRMSVKGITGLTHAEALEWYGPERAVPLGRPEGDIEPLYVELLLRWGGDLADRAAPARLADLIEWRIQGLSATEQRVMQALAIVGACARDALSVVMAERDEVDEGLSGLEKAGLVCTAPDGNIALEHAIFGRVALALAPRGALTDLHVRAAEALAGTRRVELRAYHAIRGRPGREAFASLEDSAKRRMSYGDQEGGIVALWDGMRAARDEVLGGEIQLTGAWVGFGRKLGEALIAASRLDEAFGVLQEIVDLTGPESGERALVLEQLAQVAERRGRPTEAESARRAAQHIAESAGTAASRSRVWPSPESSRGAEQAPDRRPTRKLRRSR